MTDGGAELSRVHPRERLLCRGMKSDITYPTAVRESVRLPSASWDSDLVHGRMTHEKKLEERLEKIYAEVEEPARFKGRKPRGKAGIERRA